MPAGYIYQGDDQYLLKVGDEYASDGELESSVLCNIDGLGDVHVSDVADVTWIDNSGDAYAKVNGHDGIVLSISKSSTAGTADVSDTCGAAISQLEKDFIYAGEHVGLINFFQRFLLIYGEDCRFDIRKSEYGGACVEVITPALGDEWLDSMDAGGEENAESV